MTNPFSLGWDHEDLVTVQRPKPFISNSTIIRTILISVAIVISGICGLRCFIKRKRAIALKKMRRRADEIYRSN